MKFRKAEPYLWLNKQTGYFCAVYNDEHGKWRRKSLQTKDSKEALRRFNAWRRDFFIAWGSPNNSSGSNILVEDAANEWIDHVAIRYPHSTAIQYIGTEDSNSLTVKVNRKIKDNLINMTILLNTFLVIKFTLTLS